MITKDKQLCVLEEKKLLLKQEEKEKDCQFQREMRELEEEGNKKTKEKGFDSRMCKARENYGGD